MFTWCYCDPVSSHHISATYWILQVSGHPEITRFKKAKPLPNLKWDKSCLDKRPWNKKQILWPVQTHGLPINHVNYLCRHFNFIPMSLTMTEMTDLGGCISKICCNGMRLVVRTLLSLNWISSHLRFDFALLFFVRRTLGWKHRER